MSKQTQSIVLFSFFLVMPGCDSSDTIEQSAMDGHIQKVFDGVKLPVGYMIIDETRNEQLKTVPFNQAIDGMESESMFTDEFATEIADTMERFSDFFSRHGEYGSLERYEKKLPSDWWIGDDFYSTSRVLTVDILNPELQTYAIIEGVREELRKLDPEWMLLMLHDNDFDAFGRFAGRDGSYSIWIRADRVQIYAERSEDIENFIKSLPTESGG